MSHGYANRSGHPTGGTWQPSGTTQAEASPNSPARLGRRRRRRNPRGGEYTGKEDPHVQEDTTPLETDGWATVSPDNQAATWWTPEDGADAWTKPPPKPTTLEEALEQQAHLHEDLLRDLVPFWLEGMKAAERGEDLKMEAFLDNLIAERKASGWYWTPSDFGKEKEEEEKADGWSNHKDSNHEQGSNGWGDPPNAWGTDVQNLEQPVDNVHSNWWNAGNGWNQNLGPGHHGGWGVGVGNKAENNRDASWRRNDGEGRPRRGRGYSGQQ